MMAIRRHAVVLLAFALLLSSVAAFAGGARSDDSVALRGFESARFDRAFQIDSSAMSATLRPIGSRENIRLERAGSIETVVAASRAEAESIAYEIAQTRGVIAAVRNAGGIRFVTGTPANDKLISAPLMVDADGRPSSGARWDLTATDPQGHRTMYLVVDDAGLRYPITIAYRIGSSQRPAVETVRPSTPVVNGTGAIAGTLTNSVTNQPIPDEFVLVYDSTGNFATYGVSDSNGNYQTVDGLDTGNYFALAIAADYQREVWNNIPCTNCDVTTGTPISVTNAEITGSINFALAPYFAHVTGTITNGTAPLEGVPVLFYDNTGDAVASASSDAGGFYDASVPASGTPFKARTFNFSYPGLADVLYNGITCVSCNISAGTPINVTAGGTTSGINFNLVSGGQISGTVTDSSGAIYQAQIDVFNSSGTQVASAQTDTAGVYTVINGLTAGNYFVRASAFQHGTKLYNNIPCSSCSVTSGNPVAVAAGQTTSGINFTLVSNTVSVSGRVFDAGTNAGISNVLVLFYDNTGAQVALGVTDSTGDYSTTVDAGTYYARTDNGSNSGYLEQLYNNIDCSGCNPTTGTAINAAAGTSVTGINFGLRSNGGHIAGRLTDASNGNGVAFGSVAVYNSQGVFVTYAIADSNGDYTTNDELTAGTYFATAWASGFGTQLYNNISCVNGCDPTTGTAITVTAGQTTSGINFALTLPFARISGHVSAASDNAPLSGASVVIYDNGGSAVASATTNASGDYIASMSDSGTYYAVASLAGYADQLYDGNACNGCDPTTGDPIIATVGATTPDIDFLLQTAACGNFLLSPPTLPDGTVSVAYSQQLTTSGGTGTVTFSVTSGSLPNGLSLNGSSGLISGTPTIAGTFTAVITASDSGSGCSTARSYDIEVAPAPGSTTTVLHVVPNPATYGDVVTLSATVSPDNASGTVTFKRCNDPSDCNLGTTTLGTASLPGADPNTAVLQISTFTAGTHAVFATYGGSSNPQFNPSTSDVVTLVVTKYDPNINWPTPADITWGTPLSGTQLNATATGVGGAALSGSFVYSPAATTVLEVGAGQTLTTHFDPTDTANYNDATSTVQITVVKADPVITWMPGPYTYGDPLGAAQLNATATGVNGQSLPGTFTYNPAAGTVLNAGQNTLTAHFVPTDTTHYNEADATVTLNAAKADPQFSNLSAPSIIIGTLSTTISGKISLGTLIPTGVVSITINGVTQTATIQSGTGTFSSLFITSALVPPGYTITYAYAGDSNFNAVTDTTTLAVHYATTGTKVSNGNGGGNSSLGFRVSVFNAANLNISSSSLQVTAYGVRLTSSSTWLPATPNSGTSLLFDYQNSDGGSYRFNLKTSDLAPGNYVFGYTVGADTTVYTISFTVN